jgi:hypothetical protein
MLSASTSTHEGTGFHTQQLAVDQYAAMVSWMMRLCGGEPAQEMVVVVAVVVAVAHLPMHQCECDCRAAQGMAPEGQ